MPALTPAGCSDDSPSDPGGAEVPELPEWNGRREFIGTMTFASRDGMGHWWAVADGNPTGLDLSEVIAEYFFLQTP